MDFSHTGIGNEEPENGPLFFKDIIGIIEEHNHNPESCFVVSVEENDDVSAQNFWMNPGVIDSLLMKARVVRIRLGVDDEIFEEFANFQKIEAIPSIIVYGPGSNKPSEIYEDKIPDTEVFSQRINSLELKYMDDTSISSSKAEKIEQKEEKIVEEEVVSRFPKKALKIEKKLIEKKAIPKKNEAKRKVAPKIIEVEVELPGERKVTQVFKSNETVLSVKTWVMNLLTPGMPFSLVITPEGENFLDDPLRSLGEFAPRVSLRVNTDVEKEKESLLTSLWKAIKSGGILMKAVDFVIDLFPFAREDDDPKDFWLKDPPISRPIAHHINQNQ